MAACRDVCALAVGKGVKDALAAWAVGWWPRWERMLTQWWWVLRPGRQTTHTGVLGVSLVQLYEFMSWRSFLIHKLIANHLLLYHIKGFNHF